MTYKLFIGDYAYSSWSLRGWLLFRHLGLKPTIHLVEFSKAGVAEQMPETAPAKTVPTMCCPDGSLVWDSLAMAEEMHERHPKAGLWPSDTKARGLGRSMAAEMHSGFMSLRDECPMNLRTAYKDVDLSDDTRSDIARIETIWAFARAKYSDRGPWLLGEYSIADIAFAPVAARFAGYNVAISDTARSYVDTHLSDMYFREWRSMALVTGGTLSRYAKPFETKPWPGPETLESIVVEESTLVKT